MAARGADIDASASGKGGDGQREDDRGRGKRGPAQPAAPAKSLPIASKNFFKGMRSVSQEAANMTSRAIVPWDASDGVPSCAVGVAVLAVAQGLTEHKNGRMSKEDERLAANRKPQAFLLHHGQIPLASMQKIFSCALEGGSREGSPPADVTCWHSEQQAERWFAMRKSEMMANAKRADKAAEKAPGEGGGAGAASADPPLPPLLPLAKHPIMLGLITPEQEIRAKEAAADISKWLREECSAGLDDFDMHRVLSCLSNPDRGVADREDLFGLSEEELLAILAPIREHGLKNFIVQKCKRMRQAGSVRGVHDPVDMPPGKVRKVTSPPH